MAGGIRDQRGGHTYLIAGSQDITRIAHPPRIDFWVCPREDDPRTWTYRAGQTKALCEDCGAVVIYLARPGITPGPGVPKICMPCMVLRADEAETPTNTP